MDLPSITPLAEYTDLLYSRCVLQLTPIEGLKWRIELRPPIKASDRAGSVRIHGVRAHKMVDISADMHAIQLGASVSIEAMTTVADFHIYRFKKLLTKRELG